ncbi:MAG: helix-turn-helix domain-containing protein [Nitrospinota bacterium]|nr:helix-turn-helix domain-containing protein [Nitrospinota bacterium]
MDGAHILCAICGGKGGAGKTFLATNLALYLARMGHKVGLYDADAKGLNLHTALGLKQKAVPGPMAPSMKRAEIDTDPQSTGFENLSFIPRPFHEMDQDSSGRFRALHDIKEGAFDFVLVDVEAGLPEEVAELLFSGGKGAIAITPEPSCLERSYLLVRQVVFHGIRKLAQKPAFMRYVDEAFAQDNSGNLVRAANQAIKRIGMEDPDHALRISSGLRSFSLGVTLNMTRTEEDLMIGRMFCDTVTTYYGPRAEYLGHVPYDEQVALAERRAVPFLLEHGDSQTAACLRMVGLNLSEKIASTFRNPPPWEETFCKDYYRLLGTSRHAGQETIHAAYIRAISQYAEGSRATYGAIGPAERKGMLTRIETAYGALSDEEMRAEYDARLGVEKKKDRKPEMKMKGSNVADQAHSVFGVFTSDRISGANLRHIRQSKNLSLEQIAKDTKIRQVYLMALENEAMECFSAEVFMKGFLGCYAQALGLDPTEVVGKYCAKWKTENQPTSRHGE